MKVNSNNVVPQDCVPQNEPQQINSQGHDPSDSVWSRWDDGDGIVQDSEIAQYKFEFAAKFSEMKGVTADILMKFGHRFDNLVKQFLSNTSEAPLWRNCIEILDALAEKAKKDVIDMFLQGGEPAEEQGPTDTPAEETPSENSPNTVDVEPSPGSMPPIGLAKPSSPGNGHSVFK